MAATAVRRTNWFAIWVSVAVVAVLVVIAGLVVWMNAAADAPGEAPQGSIVNSDTGAISFGSGTHTMDTYIDFQCPICNQFEQTFGGEIQSLVDDGSITLNVHPISILDRYSSGTQYSSRAASAMYAVATADPDKAIAFMQALFANQPEENGTGLTDDQIISIAQSSGVDVTDDLRKAITSGRYIDFVQSLTEKTPIQPGQQGIATPTVAINGQVIANSSLPSDPANLKDLFE